MRDLRTSTGSDEHVEDVLGNLGHEDEHHCALQMRSSGTSTKTTICSTVRSWMRICGTKHHLHDLAGTSTICATTKTFATSTICSGTCSTDTEILWVSSQRIPSSLYSTGKADTSKSLPETRRTWKNGELLREHHNRRSVCQIRSHQDKTARNATKKAGAKKQNSRRRVLLRQPSKNSSPSSFFSSFSS